MNPFFNQFQVVRLDTADHPVEEFFQRPGRYSNFQKDTFFLRWTAGQDFDAWADLCRSWQNDRSGYVYAEQLHRLDTAAVERYRERYSQGKCNPSFHFQNALWQETFTGTVEELLDLFRRVRNCTEDSILRNFTVKLLYWIDCYFPKLFLETTKLTRFPKFVCSGTVGTAEYLFLYLLYRLGCDVLYLGKEQDVTVQSAELLALSQRVEQPPVLPRRQNVPETAQPEPIMAQQRPTLSRASLQRADRVAAAPVQPQPQPSLSRASLQRSDRAAPPVRQPAPQPVQQPAVQTGARRQPMEFEELARFASSVVMLKVFDRNQECVKTGSGIIISDQGYILTNFHVVAGGAYYGIVLEEESDVFYTNELIKYHPERDLAILRSDKRRPPIPILDPSERLVRGQKVVAIGSPLGLFNTISDGIVSGFRELRETSMVQFTAPVSPGSSGGALLDLYGRLIGVITAGFDDGQNLNLAVDHKTIRQFLGNLI